MASPLLPSACVRYMIPDASQSPMGYRIDRTWIEAILNGTPELHTHPAVEALIRHRRTTGGRVDNIKVFTANLVAGANLEGMRTVLAYWEGHDDVLIRAANLANAYLPDNWRPNGSLYFEVGYDIGVAAPPDIALNVAHTHFVDRPSELAHYVTHEAHHIGFMATRPMPPLKGLEHPDTLLALIQYFTQLEGMAVHATAAPRRISDAFEHDDDYRCYVDESEALSIRKRYATHMTMLADHDGPMALDAFGPVLEAMSSGERLWYRFGALVARELERADGRDVLVKSIVDPTPFNRLAAQMMG